MNAFTSVRFLLSVLLLLMFATSGQGQRSALAVELRFGFNCNLYNSDPFKKIKGSKQRFPGYRVFGSAILNREIKNDFVVNYGLTFMIYTKSLGNNMNPLVSDIQMDFVNSVSIGYGWKMGKGDNVRDSVAYNKYLRTINSGPFSNLKHNFDNAAFFGVNYILNNHGRNQSNGNVNLTFDDFSLLYYNDADIPFKWILTADGFDRFWTGGLALFLHNKHEYNTVELSFDQFTGYQPLLYELSNILGAKVPEYSEKNKDKDKKALSSAYNSSAYNLKIKPFKNYGFDLGVIGSMRDNNGRYWGIQDLIHILKGNAVHPNNDNNRFYLGVTYEQFGYSF
jgi:Bacterial toxin 23